MPLTWPNESDLNLTPTSMPELSPASGVDGVTLVPHSEHGQSTLTVVPAPGAAMLPLSSVARTLIVVEGEPWAIHGYVQLTVVAAWPVIVAGCQVEPPSVETSTPATTPPPASVELPETVTLLPSVRCWPAVGELIVDVGAVVSVDAVAG